MKAATPLPMEVPHRTVWCSLCATRFDTVREWFSHLKRCGK